MVGSQRRPSVSTPPAHDEGGARIADEQAVLDDARDSGQRRGEPFRLRDRAQTAVKDEVAAVGDEARRRRAERGRPTDRDPPSPSGCGDALKPGRKGPPRPAAERRRARARPSAADDHRHLQRPPRRSSHAGGRRAAALDELELGIDLVGPVHGQIELGHVVDVVIGMPRTGSLGERRLGRGDATAPGNPAVTLSPRRSTKWRAVEPVPSPSRMPGSTRSSACRAASRF